MKLQVVGEMKRGGDFAILLLAGCGVVASGTIGVENKIVKKRKSESKEWVK
ncbi:MAG: hypothetical protein KBT68_05445 [bacterium]|nr:hypothetical protein [Candidatus Colisoma equi]